jgi:hypothetical protein
MTAEQQPLSEFHLGDELSNEHREDLRKMLFDDFPELFQPVYSPHVSRPKDDPIDTTRPMRLKGFIVCRQLIEES